MTFPGPLVPLVALALLAIPAAQAQTPAKATPRQAGEVVIEPASLVTPAGDTVHYELGTLYVPENRAEPRSRIIGVGFARFRALAPTGAPPIFYLPGGPGQSMLDYLTPEFERLGPLLTQFKLYRGVGDLVLVDQRGFSRRGDVLRFKHRIGPKPLDRPGSLARSTADYVRVAHAAVADLARRGVDLRGYTVKECVDDVNELREALGYDRISLVGGSFGSQWSFAVMRRHPLIVARALLTGVEPLDHGYDMPSHVFAAIQRQWWAAEQDPSLKPWLPPGGLAAAARDVLARLERGPVSVPVKDSVTGKTVKVVLGKEDFQASFRRRAAPASLLALYHGRYEVWARDALAGRRSRESEDDLIGPLIDTGLGVTPPREYLLRTDPATEFLGQWNFDGYLATAGIWPTPDVGDEFRTPVMSSIPVVFAQGDWDGNTPIENTYAIAPFFPNGRVLVAVHGGHGVIRPIAEQLPGVMETLLEFLRTGSTVNLPAQVTLEKPKLELPDFPPPETSRTTPAAAPRAGCSPTGVPSRNFVTRGTCHPGAATRDTVGA